MVRLERLLVLLLGLVLDLWFGGVRDILSVSVKVLVKVRDMVRFLVMVMVRVMFTVRVRLRV